MPGNPVSPHEMAKHINLRLIAEVKTLMIKN